MFFNIIVRFNIIFDTFQLPSGPSLNKSEQDLLSNCLKSAALQVRSKERLLNELDSGCGDGDCGITIKNFGNCEENI